MCGAILPLCLLQAILLAVGNSQPAVLPDFSAARQRMVQEQLSAPGRDIKNRLVLDAMATVPRHEFVPETLRKFAYWDEPLPIGYGQTISQPFIAAFATEQLNPKPTDRIFEVGTGSGYQAAILSRLVAEVYTIEIIEPLAKRAEADLRSRNRTTRWRIRRDRADRDGLGYHYRHDGRTDFDGRRPTPTASGVARRSRA